MNDAALLTFDHVTKDFNGVTVVDDVSFRVSPGSIVALLGANGAGKSTLIKMLAGVHAPSAGRILHRGRDVERPGGRDGIGFIHQNLGLIEWMTVAENIALWGGFARRRGLIDWSAVRSRAHEALAVVGGRIDPDLRVFDLPRTERSLVAIARALAHDVDTLVLDEPTASLPADDVARLFAVLRDLVARGTGMVYVSHRLDEVFRLADRAVVMRNGRVVLEAPVAGLESTALIEAIVGGWPAPAAAEAGSPTGPVRLTLDALVVGDVGPVGLSVARGEIVGLAGLRGAGHEAVGRAIAGQLRIDAGDIIVDGHRVRPGTPARAVAEGIAFVSSNRESEGLAMGLNVRENLFVNPALRGRGVLEPRSGRRERTESIHAIARYDVQPSDPDRAIETLSGGNQQKVILARWLDRASRVIVLEDPTMGVDVGAKAHIHRTVAEVAAGGSAVVVVSTDLDEVAALCSRAYVFDRGRVARELAGPALTTHALMDAASGSTSLAGRAVAVG